MAQRIPQVALDAIPDDLRWVLANALRAAAERWDEWSTTLAHPGMAEQFKRQADDARAFAEQYENDACPADPDGQHHVGCGCDH